ncbi:hypothetical protein [Devosia riboflavina]|uniref:hypothetical protein n=1 Tax=Devosia riboflavina TaxID=46914 RepID=UPI00126A69B6|nr:hypothetical protein [Devosia riboflavina]
MSKEQVHDYLGFSSGDCGVFDLAVGLHSGIPYGPSHSPYLYSMTKLHGQVDYPNGTGVITDLFSMGCPVGTRIVGAPGHSHHRNALSGSAGCNRRGGVHICCHAAQDPWGSLFWSPLHK